MNYNGADYARSLAWTDFILDLQDLLHEKQLDTPLYIVGGAVRDAYLRGAIKDIDIAVDGDAIAIARQLTDWLDGDIFIMDRERGVSRVFLETEEGRLILDIAQFRGDTLEADLQDRDFTVNAMAADLLGDVTVLIDPLNGEKDLNQKLLRRCSESSIADDPIRALRAIRQSVQLKLRIEPQTLADVRQYFPAIQETSPERVRDEFFNVLRLDKSAQAIRVLQRLAVLNLLIPSIEKLDEAQWGKTIITYERLCTIMLAISPRRTDNTAAVFDIGMLTIQLDRFRRQLQAHLVQSGANERPHESILKIGALAHGLNSIDGDIELIADHLRLSNDEKKQLLSMLSTYQQVLEHESWETIDHHRFWFRLGENGIDSCLLAVAHYLGSVGTKLNQRAWLELVERVIILLNVYFIQYDTVVNPTLFLNGNDLQNEFSLSAGPIIGKLLTELREAQVMGKVTNRDQALQFIQARLDSLSH